MIGFPTCLIILSTSYYHVIKNINSMPAIPEYNLAISMQNHHQIHSTKMMLIATAIFMIHITLLYSSWLLFSSLPSQIAISLANSSILLF